LAPGDLRSISLHWTGGDYVTVYPAYHFCLAGARELVVHHTHDLRENMRDVRDAPDEPYAAHTRGRNSWSIGLAVAAMHDARPDDFGTAPITPEQVEGLCVVAAHLARTYAIPIAAIRTHAEAALEDGYFGDGDEQRWDIARLLPAADALVPQEATQTGDAFRARIAILLAAVEG
jgi:hypothetical protein